MLSAYDRLTGSFRARNCTVLNALELGVNLGVNLGVKLIANLDVNLGVNLGVNMS